MKQKYIIWREISLLDSKSSSSYIDLLSALFTFNNKWIHHIYVASDLSFLAYQQWSSEPRLIRSNNIMNNTQYICRDRCTMSTNLFCLQLFRVIEQSSLGWNILTDLCLGFIMNPKPRLGNIFLSHNVADIEN
jgi:hypothetical protein